MRAFEQLSQRKLYRIILWLVIAIFVLVNLCAGLAQNRFGLKLDMTAEKLYQLSETTEAICEEIADQTDIYVVAGADYPSMFREVVARYGALSPNITVSYVDPFENPMFVDHYKQQGYNLAENDIVVSGNSGIRQISYSDMLVYSGESISGIRIEQEITSALVYVNSQVKPTALFTTGHNERITSALTGVFEDNNFAVEQSSLATAEAGEVPQTDVVVIASPVKDFAPQELEVLRSYLEQGGQLMVFVEPGVNPYPNLNGFLKEWNLSLQDNVVFEKKAYVSDNPINLIPMYAAHPANQYFAENPYYLVMPATRGLTIENNDGRVEAKALLSSTPDAYAKSNLQYDSAKRGEDDVSGPFILAAMAEKEQGEGTARLFLAGSRSVYADDIMAVDTYANRAFFTQVLQYLTGSETGVSIPAKTLAKPPLAVTMQASAAIGTVLIFVLPVGILIFGALICRKRKNL